MTDPLPVVRLAADAGVIIGTAFDMPGANGARAAGPTEGSLVRLERRAVDIARSLWGAYVAVLQDPANAGVYRDPSAGLAALSWSLGHGVTVVSSQLTGLPSKVGPARPFLNWDRIAAYLALPSANVDASLFDDVTVLGPGAFVALGDTTAPQHLVWTSSTFAADPVDDREFASRELASRVEACTSALVGSYDRVILEMSGGLDSSIVAGCVAATGHRGRVAEGLNIAFGRPESDEIGYAQAVADRLGVPLQCVAHAPDPMQEAAFGDFARAFQPCVNSVDAKWDLHEIERLKACGAQALVSGQGGDAVFFQMPSALIAADLIATKGWRALASPIVADVARRARMSVWDVAREVRRQGRGAVLPDGRSTLLAPCVREATGKLAHPWVREARAANLSPAKQLHVMAVANFHGNQRPRRRRDVADVVFPLFAQPVLEHCLRIPAHILAGASYDRAFARHTFADRLPDLVFRRRTKGLVTVYFARLVANSLAVLRPFLLDGVLADAGVLDRDALARALDPDHLIWEAKPSDILWAVAMEAWVRHWQTQVPDSHRASRG